MSDTKTPKVTTAAKKVIRNVHIARVCQFNLFGAGVLLDHQEAMGLMFFCMRKLKSDKVQQYFTKTLLEITAQVPGRPALTTKELHFTYDPVKPSVITIDVLGNTATYNREQLLTELLDYWQSANPAYDTSRFADDWTDGESCGILFCGLPVHIVGSNYIYFVIDRDGRELILEPQCLFTSNKSVPRLEGIDEVHFTIDPVGYNEDAVNEFMAVRKQELQNQLLASVSKVES